MASGFFAVLDDISVLMDDVAAMSKVAAKKTSGILGDDLAVNAEKSTGFISSRELPVIWKIAVGSFINKLIILPLVFTLSYFYQPAIIILLVIGALYLAFEGGEKVIHFVHYLKEKLKPSPVAETSPEIVEDNREQENKKVKSAIFTDFILSLEIVIIAFGTVLEKPLGTQIMVVSIIAILATVGVYGIVALLVRMDDFGFYLVKKWGDQGFSAAIGKALIWMLPRIIKLLSVIGVLALLMVSGEILVHYIPQIHHFAEEKALFLPMVLKNMLIALTVGLVLAFLFEIMKSLLIALRKKN
jgi:predicted DNA repair protein MutK